MCKGETGSLGWPLGQLEAREMGLTLCVPLNPGEVRSETLVVYGVFRRDMGTHSISLNQACCVVLGEAFLTCARTGKWACPDRL